MKDATAPNEPLSPYAQAFFGVWALVAILLVGFKADDPTYGEQVGTRHRQLDVQINWRSEVGGEPSEAKGFLTSKTPAQSGGFISLANGPLLPAQNQLSRAARTGIK